MFYVGFFSTFAHFWLTSSALRKDYSEHLQLDQNNHLPILKTWGNFSEIFNMIFNFLFISHLAAVYLYLSLKQYNKIGIKII